MTYEEVKKRLGDGQTIFRAPSMRVVVQKVVELEGEIEMWKANADEAALKLARAEARIAELEAPSDHLFEELAHTNAFEELKRRDAARLSQPISQEYPKLSQ